ncbi:hypothetical protein BDR04DRAFT_954551, partial [Suillus decipiens]
NLAEVVWNTLELCGLKNWVMAVVCDNASNNDTLLQALGEKCANEGINLSHKDSCIHCLPHIVHLAAMQLLEGIGAIKPDAKRNGVMYQDSVTVPLNCEHDDYAALLDEADDDTDEQPANDNFESLQQTNLALKIVHSVHSSPQRQKAWLTEVAMSLKKAENATSEVTLMLILDVNS